MTFKLEVLITGDTIEDVGYALDEVRSKVVDGEFTSGHGSNDTGSYRFDLIKEGAS